MNELAYLDLPHDGMGEFDKFAYDCITNDSGILECEFKNPEIIIGEIRI